MSFLDVCIANAEYGAADDQNCYYDLLEAVQLPATQWTYVNVSNSFLLNLV